MTVDITENTENTESKLLTVAQTVLFKIENDQKITFTDKVSSDWLNPAADAIITITIQKDDLTQALYNIKKTDTRVNMSFNLPIVDNILRITELSYEYDDTFNVSTGVYTFKENIPNYFHTDTLPVLDEKLAIPVDALALIGPDNTKYRFSKALNFVGDENQISITTDSDGTVTTKLSEDLSINTLEAKSTSIHGDVIVDEGGKITVEGTVESSGLVLQPITRADWDAGNVPSGTLVRVSG